MRLSEKTIELNFCAQFSTLASNKIIWFGLTQWQEARAGFDACTRYGGRLLVFQFKASNQIVKRTGARRFQLSHDQLTKLQARIKTAQRSLFYVFPLFGSTYDLSQDSDFLAQTRLLDVDSIPALSLPTTKQNRPRRNGNHYVDVTDKAVTIHSDPVEVSLIQPAEFFLRNFPSTDGIQWVFRREFEQFWQFRQLLARTSTGLIVLPGS